MNKNRHWGVHETIRPRMVRRARNMMNRHVKTPLEKKIADDYLDYLYAYMYYHLNKEELADMLGFHDYQDAVVDVKNGEAKWFWDRGDYGIRLIQSMYQELYEDYSFNIETFDETRWHKYLHGISPTGNTAENPVIINGQCVKPVEFWPWRNKLAWFYQRQQEMRATQIAEDNNIKQQEMYKIAFLDENSPSFYTGSTSYLTDDIDEFTEKWLKLEPAEDRKERFLLVKAGEHISETYDSAERIVEKSSYKIYAKKSFWLENVYFRSTNFWGVQTYYHVDNWKLEFCWLASDDDYRRMVSYKANGVCMINIFPWYLGAVKSSGNKFFACRTPYDPPFYFNANCEWPDASFADFAQNSIATICYQPIRYFSTEQDMLEDLNNFHPTFGVLDVIFDEVGGL